MCGFVGIFASEATQPVDAALLGRMNATQTHRGPDDSGIHRAPGLGLAYRRLAIIDLVGGRQPMFNEDGSVVVVYNGEIYNYRELTTELTAHGHRFATRSDTEVIVHAWEQWGERCVEHFRGMFAFALWDENQETLFLARDRLGIKPLYYGELADRTIIFGSELKTLLCHPDFAREIDPCAIEDYFAYGYVPDPRTIYRGAAKLPPGHSIRFRRGEVAIPRQYWDVCFEPRAGLDEAEAAEELTALLGEAVRLRLVSDVPLGAMLSGGIDSSSVVAMMVRHTTQPIDTFSIAFGQPEFDESRFASDVANAYASRHHSRRVDADGYTMVDTLARVYDEPFADSSALPTLYLCGLAREHVKVALSGDGGDELFAGYRRYRWHGFEETIRNVVPSAVRAAGFGLLGAFYPKLDWAPQPLRAKATLQALARDSIAGYFQSLSVTDDTLRGRLFAPSLRRDLQGHHAIEVVRGYMETAGSKHPLDRVQYADIKTYLPGDILTKVDRASMAHSLEVRVPILDHVFVEWAARLPPSFRLQRRASKRILKKAMAPYLPPHIVAREKMGFAVPIRDWLRGPLALQVRGIAGDSALAASGWFDMGFVSDLLDQHRSGLRDHGAVIWALVMFEAFLRQVHSASSAGDGTTALAAAPAGS